eukprot:TRINITY_DN1049_c0_g1_i3.p1 TRINITY_DN1049_c0_g1~~TRINITY_DN1049_c0_g1_i3.p1  ORF type:complete len:163 (-),score=61.00 TRINITY_DN1049_c0_g1_i3:297-785(-)
MKPIKEVKEREVLPSKRTDVSATREEVGSGELWALPRRAECVIQEVHGEAPVPEKRKSSRDQKRASREARLKKAMAMVEAEQPARSSPKKLLIEEVDSSALFSKDTLKQAAKAHAVQESSKVMSEVGGSKWKKEMNEMADELVPDEPVEALTATVVDLDELD